MLLIPSECTFLSLRIPLSIALHPFSRCFQTWYDLNSNGPQWHHWHADSDFSQDGINARLGVCGVNDTSLTELTIAFDVSGMQDAHALGIASFMRCSHACLVSSPTLSLAVLAQL